MTNGESALPGEMGKRKELSSVTTIHSYISTPGEILLEEFLEPMGISQYRLAKAIGKPQSAISDIVNGRRGITAEMAWLLGEALGTTAQFWLNLQSTYDLKTIDTTKLPHVEALVG
jgi:addiction module HigA family antidote